MIPPRQYRDKYGRWRTYEDQRNYGSGDPYYSDLNDQGQMSDYYE
jgi:hypothetical protein